MLRIANRIRRSLTGLAAAARRARRRRAPVPRFAQQGRREPWRRTRPGRLPLDAYIYGYSLDHHRSHARADEQRGQVEQSCARPTGTFFNVKRYPPADLPRRLRHRTPTRCTRWRWLDLTEPQVFSHPGRWASASSLFEMVDLWMIVMDSRRAPAPAAAKATTYLFTGPGWKGTVPKGMTHIQLPDALHGDPRPHLRADGTPEDLTKAVNALQAQYKVDAAVGLRQAVHVHGAAGRPESRLQHDRQAAGGDPRAWARPATST